MNRALEMIVKTKISMALKESQIVVASSLGREGLEKGVAWLLVKGA